MFVYFVDLECKGCTLPEIGSDFFYMQRCQTCILKSLCAQVPKHDTFANNLLTMEVNSQGSLCITLSLSSLKKRIKESGNVLSDFSKTKELHVFFFLCIKRTHSYVTKTNQMFVRFCSQVAEVV